MPSTSTPFTHLQVASSHSLQYGTATAQALVTRAAEFGQPIIGVTDRDGLYGAVQWAHACRDAGVAPVLGVDLAVEPSSPAPPVSRRTPARGGAWIEESRPRVVFLASGARGWASLCRLVSAAHAHTRGDPYLTWQAVQQHHEGVVALLTPDSEPGRLLAADRPWRADAAVRPWRALFGRWLAMAVTCHHRPAGHRHSLAAAARTVRWSRENHLPVVMTNAVRHLDRADAPVADILDASRLLVPLRSTRLEHANGEAFLKSSAEMAPVAEEIARAAGERDRHRLVVDTLHLAEFCALKPERDLGLGEVFVPELDVLVDHPVTDPVREATALLWQRCRSALPSRYDGSERRAAEERLAAEMRTIEHLGFAGYFLTVAEVVDMIRAEGVRVAARGSGAGSLVNHLLGISGVDPMRHGLLMERFLSPLRRMLPDIDIDVESARRTEMYDRIFERFGRERVACVAMMETYRVRHAVRDVGRALGMPAAEIDALAKSFPHVRARYARSALEDLPELRASTFGRLAAEGKLDRFLTLVESLDGLPRHVALHPCGVILSDLTLLDRTPTETSAAGYAMSQFDKHDVEHMGFLKLDVLGVRMQSAMAYALDEIERTEGVRVELDTTSLDDPATFALIRTTHTLGCFQIESPGQRELIGKFAPEYFSDLIIDISLFRPGPVKSDMVTPFLRARQGWSSPEYPHPDLRSIVEETYGVVVFHEQVMQIVATMTGCSLAEADESRRAMGSPEGQDEVRVWFYRAAHAQGYELAVIERVWEILRAFASFGFCKAHAAAFALPTYQSAWLKAHHPAAFFSGVLTHDPGMYPKRLILDDARHFGVVILGLDINTSRAGYQVERTPDGAWGLRMAFQEVKGISDSEIEALVAGQPFASIEDVMHRAGISRPTAENLVLAGAFDALYGFQQGTHRRHHLTRRDLLIHIAEHDRSRRSQISPAQLSLDMSSTITDVAPSGLGEMNAGESVRAELEILGLDVSHHMMEFYEDLLTDLSLVRARDLLGCRSQQEIFVAGVKVATQTPPIRSGRRVIFVTLDDATGPMDATFFEDVQDPYAGTVFDSWLLMVRGVVRRTGPRGVSLRATGCWELGEVRRIWKDGGREAVIDLVDSSPVPGGGERRSRPILLHASGFRQSPYADVAPADRAPSKLWHRSPGTPGW
jgi:error-prone DNA polymerase